MIKEHLSINNQEKVAVRDGYGKALLEIGEKNRNVVVLTGDLAESTRTQWFREKFPERFFEVGVAEQNMMGISAGLALSGKIPFASSFAVFSPGRSWDQLRVSVAYSEANVKIFGGHAGVSTGEDGATHQALEDIAITRVLPNLTVIVPCDWLEMKKATIASAEAKGPVYLRGGREKVATITTERTPFTIGKAEIFREGRDIAIIACGLMVYEALLAAEELAREGIQATVINCHTIKPIDAKTIIMAARKTGAIVTAEEHQIYGGLGSAVAEVVSENHPVPIRMVGVIDTFGESGQPDKLLKKYGLTKTEIITAAKRAIQMKMGEYREFNDEL